MLTKGIIAAADTEGYMWFNKLLLGLHISLCSFHIMIRFSKHFSLGLSGRIGQIQDLQNTIFTDL